MTVSRLSLQGAPLAAALFLVAIYPGGALLWLPVIALWVLRRPPLRFYPEDVLLMGFVVGVLVLTFFGFVALPTGHQSWNLAPIGYVLLIFCVLAGRWLNVLTIRWLLAFICFEALVCIVQIVLGQPYIFGGQREAILNSGETEWGSVDLLYFNRAYGLSTNSSDAAQKFLLGVLLLFEAGLRRRGNLLAAILLAAGLYCTFNRTALVAVAFFLSLKGVEAFLRTSGKRQVQILAVMILATTLLMVKWPQIKVQLLRGNLDRTVMQESGRLEFLTAGTEKIADNPIFGNYSQRFEVIEGGAQLHLHNSWLQLLADHGIVGLLLIAHALSLIRVQNLPVFVTLTLYSLAQFGLFGKFSLINIIFYYLMRHNRSRSPSCAKMISPCPSPLKAVPNLPTCIA